MIRVTYRAKRGGPRLLDARELRELVLAHVPVLGRARQPLLRVQPDLPRRNGVDVRVNNRLVDPQLLMWANIERSC